MAAINEQREVANEITELISNPTGVDSLADVSLSIMRTSRHPADSAIQEDLMKELEGLEEEALDDRLRGAENVPIHIPEGARVESKHRASVRQRCLYS
jgi:charged multivesicular body protein 4